MHLNFLWFYILVKDDLICAKLTVKINGNEKSNSKGSYLVDEAFSSKDKPVYKLVGQDRYIFFNPEKLGWFIGTKEGLNSQVEDKTYYESEPSFTISIKLNFTLNFSIFRLS